MAVNYAGVSMADDKVNGIVIRGNSPSGVLWRLEGIEISNPSHFGQQGTTGGPISMLNSNLLATSDFFSSAFPAEYGNATAGVFDLRLRDGNKNRFSGTAQIGFNGFELGLEGPIWFGDNKPRGSFIANYRYSFLDFVNKIMKLDFGMGSALPKYQDFAAVAHIPTTKAGDFKFITLIGKSAINIGRSFDLEAAIEDNLLQATDYTSSLSLYGLTHQIAIGKQKNGFLKSGISYQRFNTGTSMDSIDFTNEQYAVRYRGMSNEDKIAAFTQFKYRFNTKNNLTVGLNSTTFLTNLKDSGYIAEAMPFYVYELKTKASTLLQAHATWQHKFTDELTLNLGVHGQYYLLSNEIIGEPRVGLKWQFSPKQSLSFGYGMHSQIQSRDLYFYTAADKGLSIDNTKLKSTRSHQVVLGYDFSFAKDFRIKAEAYYQYLYKVPVAVDMPQWSGLNMGPVNYFNKALPDSILNNGTGQNVGLEITFEKFFSKGYYLLATVSLFDSKYKGEDGVLRNTGFNTNYIVNLLGGYELKLGKIHFLNFSVKGTFSGGNPYIPVDLDASIAAGREVLDWDRAFTVRNPYHLRLDAKIAYKVVLKKATIEWAFEAQNILNRKHLFAQYYNTATESIGEITQMPFTPMFLFRVTF